MGLTVWLILTMILIMVEIISLGLTSIWFAGGAFAAGLISLTGAHWLIQILTFAVVSTIFFVFTRPFAAKHLLRHVEKTNVDSLIGKEGIVKETINNFDSHGIVKISGMEWTARSADNTKIPAGETVTVQKISGVKLIVTKSYQTDKTYPVLQDFCNVLKEQPEAEAKELSRQMNEIIKKTEEE